MQNIRTLYLRATISALLAALCWTAVPPGPAGAAPDSQSPPVPRQKLVRGHWSENLDIMRSTHPTVLLERMQTSATDTEAQKHVFVAEAAIERCVTCHIIRDEDNTPVSAADSRHFCRQCHAKNAVSLNCFSCHASLPASDPAVMGANVRNGEVLRDRLSQWQQNQKGGAKP